MNRHGNRRDSGRGGATEEASGQPHTRVKKSEEAKTHFKGKRFHGAFTGGFTAGYYNTVGSAEGWTPSSFVSTRGGSRGDAATTHQQRIEELMDAEDRADLLGASLVALPEYERLGDGSVGKPGSVASAPAKPQRGVSGARRPSATSIGGAAVGAVRLAPPTQPRENLVGRRLLMGMGWRQGDGVGPRARDMDDPDDARTGLPDSGATTDAAKRTVSERDQDDNHVPTAEIEPAPHDSKESGQQRVFGASLPPGLQRKAKVAAIIDNSKPVRYKFRPVDAALRIFVRKDDSYGLGYAPGPDDVGLERMGAAGADRGGDQHGTGLGTNRVRLDSVMASGGGAGGGRNGPNVGVGYGEDDEDVFGYGSSMRNFDTSLDVGGGAASGRRGKGGGKESGRTGRDRWGGGRGTDTSGGRPYVPELVDRNRVTLDDFVPAGDSGIGSVDQRGEYPLPRVPRAFDERKVFAAPLVRTQLDLGREQLTARHRAFLLNTDAESAAREERYRAFLLRKSGVGNATTGSPNAAAPESAEETLEFRTRAMLFKSDKAATSLSSRFAPAGSGKSGAAAGAGGGADENLPADVKAARAGRFGSETRAVIEWVPDSLLCKRFSVANPYKHRRPSGAADTSSAGEVLDALRRKESEFATAAAEDAATEAAMALAPPRQQLQLVNSGGGGGGGGVNPASRRGDDNVVPPKPPVDLFKAIFEDSSESGTEVSDDDDNDDDAAAAGGGGDTGSRTAANLGEAEPMRGVADSTPPASAVVPPSGGSNGLGSSDTVVVVGGGVLAAVKAQQEAKVKRSAPDVARSMAAPINRNVWDTPASGMAAITPLPSTAVVDALRRGLTPPRGSRSSSSGSSSNSSSSSSTRRKSKKEKKKKKKKGKKDGKKKMKRKKKKSKKDGGKKKGKKSRSRKASRGHRSRR